MRRSATRAQGWFKLIRPPPPTLCSVTHNYAKPDRLWNALAIGVCIFFRYGQWVVNSVSLGNPIELAHAVFHNKSEHLSEWQHEFYVLGLCDPIAIVESQPDRHCFRLGYAVYITIFLRLDLTNADAVVNSDAKWLRDA